MYRVSIFLQGQHLYFTVSKAQTQGESIGVGLRTDRTTITFLHWHLCVQNTNNTFNCNDTNSASHINQKSLKGGNGAKVLTSQKGTRISMTGVHMLWS